MEGFTNKVVTEVKLDRDDTVPGLLKELDAFINHPDEHEKVMASFDQQYCQKYGGDGYQGSGQEK